MSTALRSVGLPRRTDSAVLLIICTLFSFRLLLPQTPSEWNEEQSGPLPRWAPEEDYSESGWIADHPVETLRSVGSRILDKASADSFSQGIERDIQPVPEFHPAAGVLFRYSPWAWPNLIGRFVAALTARPDRNEIAYVLVSNADQQSRAEREFSEAGADLRKIHFIEMPTDSIWIRDYGPQFTWNSGAPAIVDSHYFRQRPRDNFIPFLLAEYFVLPSDQIGLDYQGGNLLVDADGNGFLTSRIYQDNPGFDDDFLLELYRNYEGLKQLHIFPRLPYSVDKTGHIDMWMYIVDKQTVMISEFPPGSDPQALQITDEAARYMQEELGYRVYRLPAFQGSSFPGSGVYYTYTNALRVNRQVFVPVYGSGGAEFSKWDEAALSIWQSAAPDLEIVPLDVYQIISSGGALHCIARQIPRYVETAPSVHLVSPEGGEFLNCRKPFDITWIAIDDEGVTSVDLYYLRGEGEKITQPIALGLSNDGRHAWNPPCRPAGTGRLEIAVGDDHGWQTVARSHPFRVGPAQSRIYDFSRRAGVDQRGYALQADSWDAVVRAAEDAFDPRLQELSPEDYQRLAVSDWDENQAPAGYRYAFRPLSGRSAHLFEFLIEERPEEILDLGILWKGHGSNCVQMELYVWNQFDKQWENGRGISGENRYLDNGAANRDILLQGHIRDDFDRYLDSAGKLKILLLADRPYETTYHDYLRVEVASIPVPNPPRNHRGTRNEQTKKR